MHHTDWTRSMITGIEIESIQERRQDRVGWQPTDGFQRGCGVIHLGLHRASLI